MEEEYSWELLAGKGQIPAVITINTDRYGDVQKTCNSNHFINFHEGARIVFITEYVSGNSEIFENMTEQEELEGAVITDSNGFMWKYKTNFYRFWKTARNQLGRLLKDKEVKGSNRLNSEKAQTAEQDFINFLQDFLKDKTTEEKEELLNTKSIIWFREKYRKRVK